MINVTDFPVALFHLSNTERVNWSVQKPVLYLLSHLWAGVFHLNHSCKNQSVFLQAEEEERQASLYSSKENMHPSCWMDILPCGWGTGTLKIRLPVG